MLTVFVAATLGQVCGTGYGYGVSYGYTPAISYGPTYSYPQQTYQKPYDYAALVGAFLRDERKYEQQAAQQEQINKLTLIVEKLAQPAPAPVQQSAPQPIYQAPPPPPKVQPSPQQPYAMPSPQVPEKAPPAFQASPQTPYYGASVPPPPVAPRKSVPVPSFGAAPGAGYPTPPQQPAGDAVAALTQVLQIKCASCHAGDATSGAGYSFLNADGSLSVPDILANQQEILQDIDSGRMPRGGQRLPFQEIMAVAQGIQTLAGQSSQQPAMQASASRGFGY